MRFRPAVVILCLAATGAPGQSVYNATPDWTSTDTQVSTGAALADLDLDGWLDLVVANGNDMAQQHVVVYYNQGDGTYPATPDWQSADIAFNGHVSVADVNGDGWLDVGVAHLGNSSTTAPIARVYLNNSGTLSSLPDWTADVDGNAFGVAFGDVNNDGRPDLAVATGWSYTPQHYYANYVYLNVDGALEATASWASDDTYHYLGVLWVDADDDGWLDLVGVASLSETRMYMNLGGALETTASWSTTDSSTQDAIMATAGDVNSDGLRDLLITDNTQLAGSGRFRQYDGLVGGQFSTTYGWSYYDGNGSAVALADVNADGLLDLATGAWWDRTRLFFNTGAGFGAVPDWNSGGTSVVEKIVFGDIDNSAPRRDVETFTLVGGRRLFYLSRQPIDTVLSVYVDGVQLKRSEYAVGLEHGWITISAAAPFTVEVDYLYSHSLDMAVTNWDNSKGNYVYYNQLVVNGNCDGDGDVDLVDYACFWDCMLGPENPSDPDVCGAFDADLDLDVDLSDLSVFQSLFGG
ncbi:MAG TPA: VCBS repeat-containing protein [Phycisphaerae bacterium]|nr:VCBS repeat-containing protein [Phycisphaerae bacterium]